MGICDAACLKGGGGALGQICFKEIGENRQQNIKKIIRFPAVFHL